jgi:hypothetical protein
VASLAVKTKPEESSMGNKFHVCEKNRKGIWLQQ